MSTEAPTIPTLLELRVREDPDLQAIVSDDESLTYRQLEERTRALAAGLVTSGVHKGARVGLVMPNGIDWAIFALAVLRTGAVLVPLSTLLRPPEMLVQLRVAAVTHLMTVRSHRGRRYLEDLEQVAHGVTMGVTDTSRHPAIPSLRRLWVDGEFPELARAPEMASALEARVGAADDMVIIFTSGSRGTPKGVIHTHGNALRAVASSLESRRVTRDERLYIPMPFFWMGGFGSGLLSVLVAGATLLTETAPEPRRTIEFLQREQVTLFPGWPDQAVRIAADPTFVDADLSTLKPGSLTGVLPPAMRPAPGARANLFGMTESFGPYCGARLDLDLPASARGSCGRPFEGVEVRIVATESGDTCAAGEQGEIHIRGANMMRGICGRPWAEIFTKDGYYPTGDLGYLDQEGYLFYVGRADDMFKVKGASVYPAEVEDALRAIPGVSQAYVTNVTDEEGHDQVGAAVVLHDPADTAHLAEEARARLSAFKVPTLWAVLVSTNEVPTLVTGKVDKEGLQGLLASKR